MIYLYEYLTYICIYVNFNNLIMKKYLLTIYLFSGAIAFSQNQYSGISTSSRVGILNASINPAELTNLSSKYEINIYGVSVHASNDQISISDLDSDSNFDNILFKGNSPVNARIDADIIGPSFAMKWKKWGFGITTKGYAKFDMVDLDPAIGNAILNNDIPMNVTSLNYSNNQRLSGITYGEIGLSLARILFENDKHKFSGGITFKLLFPASYSNLGLSELRGSITKNGGDSFLTTDAPASLNIAYSGNLADNFTEPENYTKSIFGGFNGFAGDLGVTYQLKKDNKYKLNAGFSIRNIGTMTYQDDNNYNTTYVFSTQVPAGPLNLSLLANVDNLSEVEQILIADGYLKIDPKKTEFEVKLPTSINAYIDYQIYKKLYLSAFLQQKVNKDETNEQITTPNLVTITPRINLGFFETYIPVTFHEISGTNVGFGFRLGGFYLGSSSLVTTLLNDSKQGDIYTGFRWGFL